MSPRRTWHGLTLRQQREVLRAARRRQEHPDCDVADAAHRWASDVLVPGRGIRDAGIAGMLSLIADGLGGGWFGMALAERRAARRILRARAAPESSSDARRGE